MVLYGSERLLIPSRKHPLESRLRWQGITARPRQEGHYRGLVPVMEEILRGKRNDSILRFARTGALLPPAPGPACVPEALEVLWRSAGSPIWAAMTAFELEAFLEACPRPREAPVLEPIRAELGARCRPYARTWAWTT